MTRHITVVQTKITLFYCNKTVIKWPFIETISKILIFGPPYWFFADYGPKESSYVKIDVIFGISVKFGHNNHPDYINYQKIISIYPTLLSLKLESVRVDLSSQTAKGPDTPELY